MKIKSKSLGIVIFVLVFGGIAMSALMGHWQTESSKVPASFAEGEFEGMPDPADIRGSYSFADISEAFGIPSDDLIEAFGLPEDTDPATFQNKALEEIYGGLEESGTEIGNASVQLFAALYTGLPYGLEEDVYLPRQAVELLKAKAELTAEQTAYIESHGVDISDFVLEPVFSEEEAEEETRTVKGSTTFGEVLSWGVLPETVEEIIGSDIPEKTMGIRDFCTEQGLEFAVVKEAIQQVVDALQ